MARNKTNNRMIWNVYAKRSSSPKVEVYDIFQHHDFREDVDKLIKQKLSRAEFEEMLKRKLSYYFWGKVEWEITAAPYPTYVTYKEFDRVNDEVKAFILQNDRFPPRRQLDVEGAIRLDVYEQVTLNWDSFVDYIWNRAYPVFVTDK